MKGNALLRVTEAMRDRLQIALTASGVPGTVFVGPLDDADAGGAALILFLYKIVPNPSLRNREHRVATSPVQVFQNSLPLDLLYLVTVGTKPGASEETPLQALGFVMQALQTEPELTGAAVDHETVRITLEPLTTEEANRVWGLFPTANYRTSIAYLASPVWIDPVQPAPAAALVIDDELKAGLKAEVVV
jgi:hypothetical protein